MDWITFADNDHEKILEYAEVYSLNELAEISIAQNNFESLPNPKYEQCSNFSVSTSFWVCNWGNFSENMKLKYWWAEFWFSILNKTCHIKEKKKTNEASNE